MPGLEKHAASGHRYHSIASGLAVFSCLAALGVADLVADRNALALTHAACTRLSSVDPSEFQEFLGRPHESLLRATEVVFRQAQLGRQRVVSAGFQIAVRDWIDAVDPGKTWHPTTMTLEELDRRFREGAPVPTVAVSEVRDARALDRAVEELVQALDVSIETWEKGKHRRLVSIDGLVLGQLKVEDPVPIPFVRPDPEPDGARTQHMTMVPGSLSVGVCVGRDDQGKVVNIVAPLPSAWAYREGRGDFRSWMIEGCGIVLLDHEDLAEGALFPALRSQWESWKVKTLESAVQELGGLSLPQPGGNMALGLKGTQVPIPQAWLPAACIGLISIALGFVAWHLGWICQQSVSSIDGVSWPVLVARRTVWGGILSHGILWCPVMMAVGFNAYLLAQGTLAERSAPTFWFAAVVVVFVLCLASLRLNTIRRRLSRES